ncbi:MAG TPA: type II toxin-antitoxin system ParD family antitoxin [Gammaproteobacteria bacterium]|nr:type II toxin-antitoxin system ParD family antitoxin [Xanthomonadales bacterium]HOP23539.1 type II toxin-antitoxin system ParD family antitoxin [Gammaproteobacteria bacterium]HPI97029.1 type II toxin-antitoxin system ParD family antitoxin [Gammaproteobacteria bacterium]
MQRNTSITLGKHLTDFVESIISQGRFESKSEAVRAGLRLLEENEARLEMIRKKLAVGELQLDQGQGIDGDTFMKDLIG